MDLELARKKEARRILLRQLASSTSVQDPWPGGLPSRKGLSARPSLPAFGPKKSTWSDGIQGESW